MKDEKIRELANNTSATNIVVNNTQSSQVIKPSSKSLKRDVITREKLQEGKKNQENQVEKAKQKLKNLQNRKTN